MNLSLPPPPPEVDLKGILLRVKAHVARSKSWDLLDVAKRIPRKPLRDRSPGLHPSDMGRVCGRAVSYALVNAPRDRDPPDGHSIQIFNHGDAIHLQWQAYFLTAMDLGLLEDVQCEVPVTGSNVTGTSDVMFRLREWRYFVEIKSSGPTQFYGTKDLTNIGRIINTVPKDTKLQAHGYMVAGDCDASYVLFADKVLDDFVVLPVPFDDELWLPVRRRIDFGLQMIQRRGLPSKTDKMYLCRGCPFQRICDTDTELDVVDRRPNT